MEKGSGGVSRLHLHIEMQNGVALFARSLPSVVNEQIKVDTAVPSLHPHYRDFNTTASRSASVLRIGIPAFVGPPFEFLP